MNVLRSGTVPALTALLAGCSVPTARTDPPAPPAAGVPVVLRFAGHQATAVLADSPSVPAPGLIRIGSLTTGLDRLAGTGRALTVRIERR